ncbi:hypothetical protein C8R44DRAFT_767663 [Mycena epipterygia]|nr:hypothetical protein C8R44DRAFT_767663 [Mycena epipterygia]
MPVFLTNVYHLVSALCLLQIGSSLAAMAILFDGFDSERSAFLVLPIPIIFNGVMNLWKTYQLLPYSRGSRIDTTVSSRVRLHYNWLLCSGMTWGYCGFIVLTPIRTQPTVIPPALAACHERNFLTANCIPVGMSFALPFLLGITYIAASQLLRLRARAIHGTEKVPMPQPVPRPWFYRVKNEPAWMTPHVAEFETLSLEEDETKAEKV